MGSFGDSRSRVCTREGKEEATNDVDTGAVDSIQTGQDRKDVFMSNSEVGERLYRDSC